VKVLEALRHGYTAEYVAERIRQDRAEAAEHDRLAADLEAAGITVATDLPAGASRLTGLLHDGEDITSEGHAACPARGAYFPSWNPLHPVHYCVSPAEHGHSVQTYSLPRGGGEAAGSVAPDALPNPPADPDPDPTRKLVIEGNKAWKAASSLHLVKPCHRRALSRTVLVALRLPSRRVAAGPTCGAQVSADLHGRAADRARSPVRPDRSICAGGDCLVGSAGVRSVALSRQPHVCMPAVRLARRFSRGRHCHLRVQFGGSASPGVVAGMNCHSSGSACSQVIRAEQGRVRTVAGAESWMGSVHVSHRPGVDLNGSGCGRSRLACLRVGQFP
jgi:hypothetical protein